jgi:hypothetical protein
MPAEAISRKAQGQTIDPRELDELRYWHELATERVFGPAEGRDPCDLAQVGWGVIFAHDCHPAVPEALSELLEHRRRQATASNPRYYREFRGEDGYRPDESKSQFLARHGAGPGPVDPERVPYYLLLVGGGQQIPFGVQYQLDVQYAVGRISFETPEEYRRYAAGVVAAETSGVSRSRDLAFFAPENPADQPTALSRRDLVEPLAGRLAADHADWTVRTAVAEDATKPELLDLLGGQSAPALLFSASHGLGWPVGHPAQLREQGALVCQEWPGPDSDAALSADQYVCADDVADDADVHGLLAFFFACFGGATPEWDDFAHRTGSLERDRLAPAPLMSALPRRLLAHPRGGALAVAGHVDRAWGYSFSWPGAGRQTEVYRSCLARLLHGHPVGSAFEYVNQRYAELASDLSTAVEEVKYGARADDLALSTMWTANNDARGFVVLGDPAVRLFPPLQRLPEDDGAASLRLQDRNGDPRPHEVVHADVPPLPQEGVARLASAVEELADRVQRLTAALGEQEVSVSATEDVSAARFDDDGGFAGTHLRAVARISPDGNLRLLVPERDGRIDGEVLTLLLDAVQRVAEGRRERLRDLTASLPALLDAVRRAVAGEHRPPPR